MLAHDDRAGRHHRASNNVFPVRLNLDDLLYDVRASRWLPLVALRLTDTAVLATLQDNPEPLALPKGRLVQVRRVVVEEPEVPSDEIYRTWYGGDLAAAAAAHAERNQAPVRAPASAGSDPYAHAELSSETPEVAAGDLAGPAPTPMAETPDPITGWYAGDLDAVLIEHAATRAEIEARRQAHMSQKSTSRPRPKGSDQTEVFQASDEVEERMGGWFGGDLDFIVRHHETGPGTGSSEAANEGRPEPD